MNGTKYWRERFSILEDAQHRKADRSLQEIEQIYKDAQMSIQQDIERWYGRFAANNGITLAEARKILSKRDLEEFRWTVDQYIAKGQQAHLNPQWMKQLENASARYHISRLEALQLQIQQQTELLYGNQLDEMDKLLRDVTGNGYTRALFAVQKGLGVGWDSTALDPRRLDLLLSKPWTADKKTFRDRCWDQKTDLTSRLQRRMTTGILRGDSLQRMTDDFSHEIGVARSKAARLIHTETTYFNGVANREMYKDIGVDEVEILATLDTYTCGECSPLDGLRVKMVDYEPGVTVPPFHPNCRCTTIPAIDDEEDPEEIGQRAARLNEDEGGDGKTYYVPEDMNYSEWKKKFLGGGDKSDLVQVGRDWKRNPGKTGKVINSPIERGNNGNPAAIMHFDVDLNNRQKRLLESLPEYGSRITVPKKDVNMRDLSALTAKIGSEFAMFTKGKERLIVRGGPSNTPITVEDAEELAKAGYRWSGHTHPGSGMNVLTGSGGDYTILGVFEKYTGQTLSAVYDSLGRYNTFGV